MFIQIFPLFGILGTASTILGILVAAMFYRGKVGERFSLLNHFISELGEVGVSRAAWVFNTGLILGGLLLLPFMVGLGLQLGSVLGWLAVVAGMVAALGVAAVGVFPMNHLTPHTKAAMTYFRMGLVMVFLFALAIIFQPAARRLIPQAANLLSLLAFAAYASFLSIPMKKQDQDPVKTLDPHAVPERPKVWIIPILEWAVFFTTILWLFGMAVFI